MPKIIKTKIVATVGPASWDIPMLVKLIRTGVDMFRINFSHGTRDDHQRMLTNVRQASEQAGQVVALMADLCGPKIRVGALEGGAVLLSEGARITIQRKPVEGTAERISTTLAELVDAARVGQKILMDDGKLELKVTAVSRPSHIVCQVVTGGILSSGKGVNLPHTRLKLSALTEKDRDDARWIARQDFDYVALSFVQRSSDVHALRRLLRAGKSEARVVAKIEKPQAMKNLDAIFKASDVLLVARGDLGVEMSMPDVPLAQKQLTSRCLLEAKGSIVATQMLESMIERPAPTRAEVSDVANAVFDGADAVMLSGETAIGKYPDKAVAMMNSVAQRVEKHLAANHTSWAESVDPQRIAETVAQMPGSAASIARAVHALVRCDSICAVVTYTMSGQTALLLSKLRLPVPILALTPSRRVMQQACLFYGVESAQAQLVEHTRDVLAVAARHIRRLRWGRKGQKIVVVSGRPLGKAGATNTLVVHTL